MKKISLILLLLLVSIVFNANNTTFMNAEEEIPKPTDEPKNELL